MEEVKKAAPNEFETAFLYSKSMFGQSIFSK